MNLNIFISFSFTVPVAVARRNARERTRVKTVNDSYQHLKAHVPAAARTKRMSKVEMKKMSLI